MRSIIQNSIFPLLLVQTPTLSFLIPTTRVIRVDTFRKLLRYSSSDVILDAEVISDSSENLQSSRRSSKRASNRSVETLRNDFSELIGEYVKVGRKVGGGFGLRRTFQAATAIFSTSIDFFGESFSEGNFSARNLGQKDSAKYLRIFFERMGATYVKLGQFIASSPTIFPKEFVLEMQKCLDSTEPIPFSTVLKIVKKELGRSTVSSKFSYIDPKPLASASIAQVHRAKLTTGESVVLKVQKPGVSGVLEADLGFLYLATKTLEVLQPALTRASLSAIVGDIRASMLDELDFIKEIANIKEFQKFLEENDITQAKAPKVYEELSTKKVLTMEFLKGVPLTDLEGIKGYSANPEATLISALNTWSLSVMMCKSFHADVHAGNLLVLEDGRVGFIDFGIVGRIPEKIWGAIGGLSNGIATGDYNLIARSLVDMGTTDSEVDLVQFAFEIEGLVKKIENLNRDIRIAGMANEYDGTIGISATLDIDQEDITKVLIDIVQVAENNGLKLPREFGLLIKQALYFDVYTNILAPGMNVLNDERVLLPDVEMK
mmetsp:Transcript_4501/g.6439  ORF Transcript_4501/g.6439 Transcript_4501/m.6439 type:complete len:546 (-) Transcript_4501:5-1642(-)